MLVAGCTNKQDTGAATGSNSTGLQQTKGDADKDNNKAGSGSSLSDILSGKSLKYTATYEVTVAGQKQTWVQAYNLPNFVTIVRLPIGETRMIFKDSTMYTCNNMQEEWSCLELESAESNTNNALESDVKSGTAKPVYVGTCSRAGISGQKYTVTAEGATSTICYSKKGVLLEMESVNMTMYATSVSDTVDSQLFELPVPAQSMPDFGDLIPGGVPKVPQ
jgi:hypothetical protein